MKRFETVFTFLQLPVDYLLLVLAGFTAYTLRYADIVENIRPVQFNLAWTRYWPLVMWVALGWIIIFALNGLYHTNPNRKLAKDLTRLFFACATGFSAITIYVFFTLQKFDSRFLVLAGWILAVIYVSLGRLAIRGLKALFHRLGVGLRKTVVIGNHSIAAQIQEALSNRPTLGYVLVGVYDSFNTETIKKLTVKIPDEIIFTNPENKDEAIRTLEFADEHHIAFKYSADLFETISSNMTITTIAGIPIVQLGRTRLSGWNAIIKRLFDFLGSLILLIVLSPVLFLISLVILIETGRPVIYKNERVGQAGYKFRTYKFRSMYQKDCVEGTNGEINCDALKQEKDLIKTNSIKTGPVYKIKNDPRVTPFGRFIRRWSLDELPQLWNVFKGDMSLIGPRPHQTREVDKYERSHKAVLTIRPGLSGLTQISGRSNLTFEEEVKLDTFYIEHWSLWSDFIILLKTPFIVLLRKGAL
ncbi:MAG TPA: sugar transferase [Patescibacteria group bacterium]|nr:sugar transferase [Patescibacteria group bacterium]